MINFIEYKNLPSNFWDKVIYYEYFVSFSGFVKDEPCITFWTLEGKVYYLNISELRDGRFERVIPFFESMTNQKKIDQGDLFYFNWRLILRDGNAIKSQVFIVSCQKQFIMIFVLDMKE